MYKHSEQSCSHLTDSMFSSLNIRHMAFHGSTCITLKCDSLLYTSVDRKTSTDIGNESVSKIIIIDIKCSTSCWELLFGPHCIFHTTYMAYNKNGFSPPKSLRKGRMPALTIKCLLLLQVSAVANWPVRQNRAVDRAWQSLKKDNSVKITLLKNSAILFNNFFRKTTK